MASYIYKNIGSCLTGFAINNTVSISNLSNVEMQYVFQKTVDASGVFNLNSQSLTLDPGASGYLSIDYVPSLNATDITETGLINISSYPTNPNYEVSGDNVFLVVTGNKLLNITGGNARSFLAYQIFGQSLGLQFKWLPPSGNNSNLNNYFITGYQIDVCGASNFASPTGYVISVPKNSNNYPVYGAPNGFSEDYLTFDYTGNFIFNQDYYSRIYSLTCGNTGVSIFASGTTSLYSTVPNQVLSGYSGSPINLKVSGKKSFDVKVSAGSYTDCDLYSLAIAQNNNNNDFSYYSGFNFYFTEGTNFYASSVTSYPISFFGDVLNLTGSSSGTYVNLIFPDNVNIYAKGGKGGNIQKTGLPSYTRSLITGVNSQYYAPENGGSAFNLYLSSITTGNKVYDLKYNITKSYNNQVYAGGGGSQAGYFQQIKLSPKSLNTNYFKDTFGETTRYDNIWINGNSALNAQVQQYISWNSLDSSSNSMIISTPSAGYGESGNCALYIKTASNSNSNNFTQASNISSSYVNTSVTGQIFFDTIRTATSADPYYLSSDTNYIGVFEDVRTTEANSQIQNANYSNFCNRFYPVYTTKTTPGKLFNLPAGAVANLYINQKDLPSNSLFRFKGSSILDAGASSGWPSEDASYSLLNSSGSNYGSVNTIYGLKNIAFNNSEFMKCSFASSIVVNDFDMFFVVSVSAGSSFPFVSKIIDWSTDITNLSTNNNFKCSLFNNADYSYPKENYGFQFVFNLLRNQKFINYNLNDESWSSINQLKIGTSINDSSYYPMIINVSRSSNIYSIYVNGSLIYSSKSDKNITNLLNTFLQIGNTASSVVSYFDILFYNKNLTEVEKSNIYSYYISTYFNLFLGSSGNEIENMQFRIPNMLGMAGKNSF